MEEYTLRNNIQINRPIIFLCGPYYNKKDKSDRRNILKKEIESLYKNRYIPLIIDDFLTDDNIKDKKINIQLLEEIFAAISYKTFIFLDTMSSASELGLFLNSAFINNIQAFIPTNTDIINKGNVGYFVKDVMLKMNGDRAKVTEYRPAIIRKAIATDYVVEHYKFINNQTPLNIYNQLVSDEILNQPDDVRITTEIGDSLPDKYYKIIYKINKELLNINVSVRLMFYITTSIVYNRYSGILKINKKRTIKDFDLDYICEQVKICLKNFVIKNSDDIIDSNIDVNVNTVLKYKYEDIIYHMVTFIYVYHCFSTYFGKKLLLNYKDNLISEHKLGINPFEKMAIDHNDFQVIKKVKDNPYDYFEEIKIFKKGKQRKLIKYKDDINGNLIKQIHGKLLNVLQNKYEPHKCSFAYKKGSSIKNCAELHIHNNSFIKFDISKFFNSINKEKLVSIIMNRWNIDENYRNCIKVIIDSFFINDELPLGLVISPILSDIYMNDVDNIMYQYAQVNEYVYSRYADDIMFSKKDTFDTVEINNIEKLMSDTLTSKKLKLNDKKQQIIHFKSVGSHIRYVGVSIVKGEEDNYISVGKSYINDIAKEYLHYLHKKNSLKTVEDEDEQKDIEENLFYEARRISGKVGFLKMIEGEAGWNKLALRLKKNIDISTLDQLAM